jgi:hypothetical protein
MRIQIAFMPLIRNKRWLRIQMCSALVILAVQANYSYAVSQTFSGSSPQIDATYDLGKDETTVFAGTLLEENSIEVQVGFPPISMPVKEDILLAVAYAHEGRRLTSPPSVVTIGFESRARQFRFGEGIELLGVIDGKRLTLGQMSYTASYDPVNFLLLQSFNVEYLRVDVPLNTFLTLARARTATLILGNKKLQLEEQNFNVLSAIANCMIGKTVPTRTTSVGGTANPAKCPIQAPDLPTLRGFKLGMSVQDARKLFPESAPPISEPDTLGRRSMIVKFPRPQDAYGATRLDQVNVSFFDDRICRIEASYDVGKEWRDRQKDFAYFISKELGVSVTWEEDSFSMFTKLFSLRCADMSMSLHISEEAAFKGELFGSEGPWVASAMLSLTDHTVETRLRQRLETKRQREQ